MATIAADLTIEELLERLYAEIAQLKAENALLREQVATLTQIIFGKSTEKSPPAKQSSGESDSQPPPGDEPKPKKGNRGGVRYRRNHDHLPVQEDLVDLSDSEKQCPCCGEAYADFTDVTEGDTIEIEVKGYKRRVRRKSYLRKCNCKDAPKIVTAPTPGKIIPKGSLGTSVWIELLLGKFLFYTPTNRLINQLALCDIFLAASTIIDGMKKLSQLIAPCYELICERNKEAEKWHADETGWLVHEKVEDKENSNWFIWVFKSIDTVVYKLSATRSSETIKGHLGQDVDGVLSCDRFSAYKKYAMETDGGIDLAFCWAHVRRDFIRLGKAYPEYSEWSKQVVEVEIRELYRLHAERKQAHLKEATSPETLQSIDTLFNQKMTDFLNRRREELKCPNFADCQRKVNKSLIEHWQGLTVVLADPTTDMDNNAAERALRGPVVARKNFWGSMMEWSGQLAVMMFSLIQTLLLWGVNPKLWLTMYFEECAKNKGRPPDNIGQYLPWNLSIESIESLSLQSKPQLKPH